MALIFQDIWGSSLQTKVLPTKALFTQCKLTRVSFWHVNTANPGSFVVLTLLTRVRLEKCYVNTTWVNLCHVNRAYVIQIYKLPFFCSLPPVTYFIGGSDRGSYFIPKKSQHQNLSTLLFSIPKKIRFCISKFYYKPHKQ